MSGQFLKAKDKQSFRREKAEKIDSYEEAVRQLKDSRDTGVKSQLPILWIDFTIGVEIIMDCFHGIHDFLALLSIVLLPMKLLEIGLIGILGIE